MNSRERVSAAIHARPVDIIPLEYHPCMRGLYEHGEDLRSLIKGMPGDFEDFSNDPIPVPAPDEVDEAGEYHAFHRDDWGVLWEERIFSMVGHACEHPISDFANLAAYPGPVPEYGGAREQATRKRVSDIHAANRYAKLGFFGIFEQMISLRGFETVLMDLALDAPEAHQLADMICGHFEKDIQTLLDAGVDCVGFGDDYGTQRATLISPKLFRNFFKPRYEQLMAPVLKAGVDIHFHSCGNVWDLMDDFAALGVNSVWPQLSVYQLDELAAKLRHLGMAIAIHPDRASVMTRGTPDDVKRAMDSYESDDIKTPLLDGHIYLLPCVAGYSAWQNPENPLVCTYLHYNFAPKVLRRLLDLPCSAFPQETALFAAVREAIIAGNEGLLQKLAPLLCGQMQARPEFERANDAVSRSVQYIHQHLDETVPIARLAAQAGYQREYFVRLFKSYMGITPYQYLKRCRLALAKTLLNNGESLELVANRTGYSDAKVFSKVFRQSAGMPPTAYRKAWQPVP